MVAEILAGLSKPLTRETFALVLDMIRMDSLPVQEALRALLPELSQGSFAEELRQGLLAALTVVPGEGPRNEPAAAVEDARRRGCRKAPSGRRNWSSSSAGKAPRT